MSRTFVGTLENINCGHAAALANVSPFTFGMLVYPDLLLFTAIYYKTQRYFAINTSGGDLTVVINRAIANAKALTFAAVVTTGTPYFLACSYKTADGGPRIYKMSLETDVFVAEEIYFIRTDGSGAFTDDTANDFLIGGIGDAGFTIRGTVEQAILWNTVLTLEEMAIAARGFTVQANNMVAWWPLWGTTNPEPDWSQNFNTGVVTGTSVGRGFRSRGVHFAGNRIHKVIRKPIPIERISVKSSIIRSLVTLSSMDPTPPAILSSFPHLEKITVDSPIIKSIAVMGN